MRGTHIDSQSEQVFDVREMYVNSFPGAHGTTMVWAIVVASLGLFVARECLDDYHWDETIGACLLYPPPPPSPPGE